MYMYMCEQCDRRPLLWAGRGALRPWHCFTATHHHAVEHALPSLSDDIASQDPVELEERRAPPVHGRVVVYWSRLAGDVGQVRAGTA